VNISVEYACAEGVVELNVINEDPIDELIYQWNPVDAFEPGTANSPTPDYLESDQVQTVSVTAINQFECEATVETLIDCPPPLDPCTPDYVYLPNFFTPNGDDSNDVLRLRSRFLEELTEVELMIYDRWGEEVFRTTDRFAVWDGTYKGELLAPDVYGFYLRVICPGGEELVQKGNITLLR
jgi:gliding motility-associated-like protein